MELKQIGIRPHEIRYISERLLWAENQLVRPEIGYYRKRIERTKNTYSWTRDALAAFQRDIEQMSDQLTRLEQIDQLSMIIRSNIERKAQNCLWAATNLKRLEIKWGECQR